MRPLPLITLQVEKQENGAGKEQEVPEGEGEEHYRFEINEEAMKVLLDIDQPVGVISIAGVYRSGKSFILNQLAGYKDGFNIGSTVEPCTQGIWMWVVEDRVGPENCKYLLLDTEGLGSYIKTETYDVQIFSLALLLGSFFIYNSVSNIDEGSIDKLSLVVQLTKHIRAQAEGDDDPQHLKMYFPSFMWLVRDFALDLTISGKKVTAKEYLDNALLPLKGDPKKVEGRNKVREFIKQFFADRDCFTLVRPVADEQMLQNLSNVEDENLRPEYKNQVNEFKDLVYQRCTPKKMHGQNLNGPMLVELIRSYIESINSGAVLTISTAWENVVHQECQKALNLAMKTYESKFVKTVSEQVLEIEQLEEIHKECFAAATKSFRSKAVGGKYWQLEDELDKFVEDLYKRVKIQNYQRSQSSCDQVMRNLLQKIDEFITENKQATIEQVEIEWARTLDDYHRAAKGPAKSVIEANILARQPIDTVRRVHSNITKELSDNFDNKLKLERERHDEEYKRISKLHEEAVLVRAKLDSLVSLLTQENADLNKKLLKSEEEMRVLLNQCLKLQKRADEIEKEQLVFLRHKVEVESHLKKKGIDLSDFTFSNDKCSVM